MADDIPQGPNPVPVGRRKKADQARVEYTGEIRRADAEGAIIKGFLIDKLGYRITLRGHKDPRAGHGYFLYGEVTHIPEHWRVEAIDDDG